MSAALSHPGPRPPGLTNPAGSCDHRVSIGPFRNALFHSHDLRFGQQTLPPGGQTSSFGQGSRLVLVYVNDVDQRGGSPVHRMLQVGKG